MQKHRNVLCMAVCAVLLAFAGQVTADPVIGANFAGGFANTSMTGKTFDGLSSWTNTTTTSGSNAAMLGTGGAVTFGWSCGGFWYGGEEQTVDQQLYRGYLDDGAGVSINITGLAAWLASENLGSYTIRIYQNSDNAVGGYTPIDIKSGDTVLTTVHTNNIWTTDGGYRGFVDTKLLTADSIAIRPRARVGTDIRASVSGFKITGHSKVYPVNPVPAEGQEVLLDQVLSWEQVPAAAGMGVTYRVYFGDANSLSPNYYANNPVKTTTTDVSDFFYAPTLDFSSAYAWRVDALEPNSLGGNPIVHTGFEWAFVTAPPLPRVDSGPVYTTAPAGTDAVLSIEGINIVNYQWYKDGAAISDAGGKYSGANSAELTVLNVQLADEGYYYCQVDNGSGDIDVSDSALLLTKRLVGWWKMDGDLTDSVGQAVAGALAHDGSSVDPNFVAGGKDGGAIEFRGSVDGLVTVPDSADYFNFYTRAYTLSVWVQNTATGGWACYISKEQRPEAPWKGYALSQSDGKPVIALRQSGDGDGVHSGVQVSDGAWHLVTATYEADAGLSRIYVDGRLSNTFSTTGTPTANPYDMIFGAELADGSVSAYVGRLDDIRVWNYALDSVAIANLYLAFNPQETICLEYPLHDVAGPDGVGPEYRDCRVNIYDFASVAATWLECNSVPDCIN